MATHLPSYVTGTIVEGGLSGVGTNHLLYLYFLFHPLHFLWTAQNPLASHMLCRSVIMSFYFSTLTFLLVSHHSPHFVLCEGERKKGRVDIFHYSINYLSACFSE